jgi:hypothetical protein
MAILQDNKIVNVEQVSLLFDASVLVFGIPLLLLLHHHRQSRIFCPPFWHDFVLPFM